VLEGNPWINDFRHTYFYDTENRIITETHESFLQDEVYENKDSITNIYDTYGNLLESNHYNNYSGETLPDLKVLKTYDENNRETVSLYQDYESGNWVNSSKSEFIYLDGNTEDYPDQLLHQNWINNDWENYRRRIYTYTFNPNLTTAEDLGEKWTGTMWEQTDKDIYEFNANGLYSSYEAQNFTDDEWVFRYKYYYYYETYDDGSLSIDDKTKPSAFQLVSNPVTNQLSFIGNLPNQEHIVVFLYNMQGQLVLMQNKHLEIGKNNFTIQVNHLTSGVYLYTIKSKNGIESGKIIKR